jgi:hypothetical protein
MYCFRRFDKRRASERRAFSAVEFAWAQASFLQLDMLNASSTECSGGSESRPVKAGRPFRRR